MGHDEGECGQLINMLDVFFRAVFLLDEVVKRAEAGDVDDRAAGLEPLKSLLLVDQELRI